MLKLLEEIPTDDVFPPDSIGRIKDDEEFDEEYYEDENE